MVTSRSRAPLIAADRIVVGVVAAIGFAGCIPYACATSGRDVQARIDHDVELGRAVVVHVVVALCDNEHQGIVRVPSHLGNGRDPRANLYWGALYGVRTFLSHQGGWRILASRKPDDERILERVVFFDRLRREGARVPVYIVADAWDGAEMRAAIERFLAIAGGREPDTVSVMNDTAAITVPAGGAAHLVAFVGHNGLMDFSLSEPVRQAAEALPASSLVLACASRSYFHDLLRSAGSHPLLLTTGLMAPEAYTLNSAIRSWIEDGSVAAVREAAAQAYAQYQGCGLRGARGLFWGASP